PTDQHLSRASVEYGDILRAVVRTVYVPIRRVIRESGRLAPDGETDHHLGLLGVADDGDIVVAPVRHVEVAVDRVVRDPLGRAPGADRVDHHGVRGAADHG